MQRGLGGLPHERYPKVYPLGLHQEGERERGKGNIEIPIAS
jgi:hypothetical protein